MKKRSDAGQERPDGTYPFLECEVIRLTLTDDGDDHQWVFPFQTHASTQSVDTKAAIAQHLKGFSFNGWVAGKSLECVKE